MLTYRHQGWTGVNHDEPSHHRAVLNATTTGHHSRIFAHHGAPRHAAPDC